MGRAGPEEVVGVRTVRDLLQRSILALQRLMADHPPSRRLQRALAVLWATADSLEELEAVSGPRLPVENAPGAVTGPRPADWDRYAARTRRA